MPFTSQSLAAQLTVGEPDVAGPLAVFPLFGAAPRLEYRAFAEAAALGATVTELSDGASVNDLLVSNPLDQPVLLYEGELLLGAQQDRTVDHAVLVPAGAQLRVPVSCVEAGRWDGTRHGEAFTPGTHAAFAELRRRKSEAMRRALAVGLEARADQGEVWETVEDKLEELHVASPTAAMPDITRDRGDELDDLRGAINRRDGQLGAVAVLDGRPTVLDLVSRADVFAALHGPLVGGYALDALSSSASTAARPERAHVDAFLAGVLGGSTRRSRAVGIGESVAVASPTGGGTGLIVEDELVQLCAYAGESARAGACVVRPSRRR